MGGAFNKACLLQRMKWKCKLNMETGKQPTHLTLYCTENQRDKRTTGLIQIALMLVVV